MAEEKQFSADTVADEYYKIEASLRTETPDSPFHTRISFVYWRLQTWGNVCQHVCSHSILVLKVSIGCFC